MPKRIIITITVLTVILGGCGGSSTRGAGSPTSAVKTYLTAVATGDGSGACSMLTSALQTRALNTAHTQGIKVSSCAALFSQVKSHMTTTQRSDFVNAKVTNVTRSGNTAQVTVTGGTTNPTLVENGGAWLISGGVGF